MLALVSLVTPWVRVASVLAFTLLLVVSSYALSRTASELFVYDDGALVRISSADIGWIHATMGIERAVHVAAAALLCASLVQVPSPARRSVGGDDNQDNASSSSPTRASAILAFVKAHTWDTHSAVMMLIAAGVNSNRLFDEISNGDLVRTHFHESSQSASVSVRHALFYIRLASLVVSLVMVTLNMTVLRPDPLHALDKPLARVAGALIFVFQFAMVCIHFFSMNPRPLALTIDDDLDADATADRYREFVLDACIDWALAFIGVVLSFVAPPPPPPQDDGVDDRDSRRNRFAGTFLFNNCFLGSYGTVVATRMEFAIQYAGREHVATSGAHWVPLVIFCVLLVVSAFGEALQAATPLRSTAVNLMRTSFRALGGSRAPVILLWRLAIGLGVVSSVVGGLSASAHWFTFTVAAGAIPNEVGVHAVGVEQTLSDLGMSALGVVQKLDPCRWSMDEPSQALNSTMSYRYPDEYRYTMERSAMTLETQHADISRVECKCRSSEACDCGTLNVARKHVAAARQDKKDFAARTNISFVHDHVTHFEQITEDTMYADAMKQCHSKECSVVLGIAVAAEASIVASGTVWFIPGLEEVISTAAWFAQLMNRVGHGVIKYGFRLAKFLTNLASKIKRIRPFIRMVLDLADLVIEAEFKFSMDLLMVYIPLFLNGAFCFLLGFWRRRNVKSVSHMFAQTVGFLIPLFAVNAVMAGLTFVFPLVVADIVRYVPEAIMLVSVETHTGFHLLRYAYLGATLSCLLLIFTSIVDDLSMYRERAAVVRRLLRRPVLWARGALKMPLATSASVVDGSGSGSGSGEDEVQNTAAWMQAFAISAPVLALTALVVAKDFEFVQLSYGPQGKLLAVVHAFHSHRHLLEDTKDTHTYFEENSLCGLIGKGIEAVISTAMHEMHLLFENAVDTLEAFASSIVDVASIISSFEASGESALHFIEGYWKLAEKLLVLVGPFLSTVAMLLMVFVKDAEERRLVKQLVTASIYYNFALIVMIRQLFKTINGMDMHYFYFSMREGPLLGFGVASTMLNALSLFSLYVDSLYNVNE